MQVKLGRRPKGGEMMKYGCSMLMLLAASVALLSARPASGQYGITGPLYGNPRQAGTRPRRSSFSPYLDLYRRDSGVLDNYHQFVRPEIQLRKTLDQQRRAISRQGRGLRTLGRDFGQFQRQSMARPTGTSSVFMNYSHFFPSAGVAGRRR